MTIVIWCGLMSFDLLRCKNCILDHRNFSGASDAAWRTNCCTNICLPHSAVKMRCWMLFFERRIGCIWQTTVIRISAPPIQKCKDTVSTVALWAVARATTERQNIMQLQTCNNLLLIIAIDYWHVSITLVSLGSQQLCWWVVIKLYDPKTPAIA